ncbi:hypothetical protein H2204_000366 [Knufia peltigerae]|uniref:Acyl-CoA dehydrogenase n=1 Tax=Knufia peltigerae TaxID=1002370 RepID=A0AA38YET8_9EURO|nr:hypothetical protein H2204_000366 [Knufia peltigerae]
MVEIPEQYRSGVGLPGHIRPNEWDAFHFLILSDEKWRVETGVHAGLSTASIVGLPPIIDHGTDEQKGRWLPGVLKGETSFCLGATEPTGGSDLANLKTTARKTADGRHYVVNGHKKWITLAMDCSHMTTAVRTGGPGAGGISVLVIDTKSPGISMRMIHNSGVNAARSVWVTMEDVMVPAENLLGVENQGFHVLMSNFNKERYVMAVSMNRKTRTCLSIATRYAHDRVTFGQPLIANQIIRHKLASIGAEVESHWAWLEQLTYHVKLHGWTNELASRIALAKVLGGNMLERAVREAQQILGGAGYQRGGIGGQVEQISRDLRMMVVGGGSEEIIADLAVRREIAQAKRKGAML